MERIQAQTQVGRGSKAMKRPASQKRPVTSLQKTASKRGKKDEQVEQEGEEEEPKEEDEEEEEQKSKRLPLTQKALKDHQAFGQVAWATAAIYVEEIRRQQKVSG